MSVNFKAFMVEKDNDGTVTSDFKDLSINDLPEGEVIEPVENDELPEAYANAMARIAELEAEVRGYQLKDMQADELKAILTERNIEFGSRDSKDTLLKLVIESE